MSQYENLDDADNRLLSRLATGARATNRQLARTAGIAESTALVRLRRLEERGVITGYEAVIGQAQLGRGLQALIGVTLRSCA